MYVYAFILAASACTYTKFMAMASITGSWLYTLNKSNSSDVKINY